MKTVNTAFRRGIVHFCQSCHRMANSDKPQSGKFILYSSPLEFAALLRVIACMVIRRVRMLLIIVYFHFQVDCHLLPNGPTWIWWLLLILPLGPAVQVRNITSNGAAKLSSKKNRSVVVKAESKSARIKLRSLNSAQS